MKCFEYMFILVVVLAGSGQLAMAGPYSDGISDGIAYNDPDILGWATGSTGQRPAYATFGTWADALGPAPAVSNDVVSLGDAGHALLTFDPMVIADGPGPDLAVFENAILFSGTSNVFAELGFVEVSTDGLNFVRFPSHSLTPALVGSFGVIDPTNVDNLAGKHVNNEGGLWLGTPFDLADLASHPDVLSGAVDLLNINYVKIIDVVGDGSTFDSQDNPIYDPYPTSFAAGGFDLDAVAILNTPEPTTGDFDEDGDVDGVDFGLWQAGFPTVSGAMLGNGDADGDSDVDGVDFGIWQANFPTAAPAPVVGPTAVPEPATLFVMAAAGLGMLLRSRRTGSESRGPNPERASGLLVSGLALLRRGRACVCC